MKLGLAIGSLVLCVTGALGAQEGLKTDVFPLKEGSLKITFIGHGTLMFDYNGTIIHVDPVGREADYSKLPKADLILITHEHFDHLDSEAIAAIRQKDTDIVLNESSARSVSGIVMKNGEQRTVRGLKIEAVPAYNTTSDRDKFHPRGRDNGYVVTFGNVRVYIAGDTENHPQMMGLKDIDIAFLPMNQPYTMTPVQAAEAARSINPGVLYPYHFGETDVSELTELLKDADSIEVRIRDLQ